MSLSEVSLKWNGFETNMLNNLKYAFRDEDYADVSLVCEGISVKSHKVVLSACSPMFKNIFSQNPHPYTVIVLQDVSLFNLKALLTFIYNGELNINEKHLSELLKVAENLKIRGLTTIAEDVDEHHELHSSGNFNTKKSGEGNSSLYTEPSEIGNIFPKEEPPDLICVEAILNEGYNDDNTSGEQCEQQIFYNTQPDMQMVQGDTSAVHSRNLKEKSIKDGKIKKKKIKQKKKTHMISHTESSDKSNMSDFEVGKENMVTDEDIEKDMDNVLQADVVLEAFNSGAVCDENTKNDQQTANLEYVSPKLPCPFCSRVYHTWGYRRRHIKSRHKVNRLTCKVCKEQTTSQSSWFDHVVRRHALSRAEARDSLVILVEAHAVLTCTSPPSPTHLLNEFKKEHLIEESMPI